MIEEGSLADIVLQKSGIFKQTPNLQSGKSTKAYRFKRRTFQIDYVKKFQQVRFDDYVESESETGYYTNSQDSSIDYVKLAEKNGFIGVTSSKIQAKLKIEEVAQYDARLLEKINKQKARKLKHKRQRKEARQKIKGKQKSNREVRLKKKEEKEVQEKTEKEQQQEDDETSSLSSTSSSEDPKEAISLFLETNKDLINKYLRYHQYKDFINKQFQDEIKKRQRRNKNIKIKKKKIKKFEDLTESQQKAFFTNNYKINNSFLDFQEFKKMQQQFKKEKSGKIKKDKKKKKNSKNKQEKQETQEKQQLETDQMLKLILKLREIEKEKVKTKKGQEEWDKNPLKQYENVLGRDELVKMGYTMLQDDDYEGSTNQLNQKKLKENEKSILKNLKKALSTFVTQQSKEILETQQTIQKNVIQGRKRVYNLPSEMIQFLQNYASELKAQENLEELNDRQKKLFKLKGKDIIVGWEYTHVNGQKKKRYVTKGGKYKFFRQKEQQEIDALQGEDENDSDFEKEFEKQKKAKFLNESSVIPYIKKYTKPSQIPRFQDYQPKRRQISYEARNKYLKYKRQKNLHNQPRHYRNLSVEQITKKYQDQQMKMVKYEDYYDDFKHRQKIIHVSQNVDDLVQKLNISKLDKYTKQKRYKSVTSERLRQTLEIVRGKYFFEKDLPINVVIGNDKKEGKFVIKDNIKQHIQRLKERERQLKLIQQAIYDNVPDYQKNQFGDNEQIILYKKSTSKFQDIQKSRTSRYLSQKRVKSVDKVNTGVFKLKNYTLLPKIKNKLTRQQIIQSKKQFDNNLYESILRPRSNFKATAVSIKVHKVKIMLNKPNLSNKDYENIIFKLFGRCKSQREILEFIKQQNFIFNPQFQDINCINYNNTIIKNYKRKKKILIKFLKLHTKDLKKIV